MQRGASKASSVHCILVYTPPYLSCRQGGILFYSNIPRAKRDSGGKGGVGGVRRTENDCEGVSVLNPATE